MNSTAPCVGAGALEVGARCFPNGVVWGGLGLLLVGTAVAGAVYGVWTTRAAGHDDEAGDLPAADDGGVRTLVEMGFDKKKAKNAAR